MKKVTNIIPPLSGGATLLYDFLPSIQTIIQAVIVTTIGTILGYFIKLFLDKLIQSKDDKNNKHNAKK